MCVRLPPQHLVDQLQQRVVLLAAASSRDGRAAVAEGLLAELRDEAQRKAAMAESLQAELRDEAQHWAAVAEGLRAELLRQAHFSYSLILNKIMN